MIQTPTTIRIDMSKNDILKAALHNIYCALVFTVMCVFVLVCMILIGLGTGGVGNC